MILSTMNLKIRKRVLLCVLAPLVLLSTPTMAEKYSGSTAEHRVFTIAPTPEEIADILFPKKYRSAANPTSTETPAPLFSMMINFEFDSATILPESIPMLQALGEMLGIDTVANRSIVVEGHTDSIGSTAYNQHLSEKRARAIKLYLVEQYGVAPKRLVAVGKGERQLLLSDEPKAPMNRRATFRPAKN